MEDIKFDLNDITLVPAELSSINSRTLVNTKYDTGYLPLIVSPMDSVINSSNNHIFIDNNLLTCSIRTKNIEINSEYTFNGVSLQQFEELALGKSTMIGTLNNFGILVDIASGNLLKLYNLVIEFKKIYPEISLMIGNIANPKTYAKYCEILTDIDFIRCSIGSGSVCTTGSNTGIYYPMGSLIKECFEESCKFNSPPKIVADGGFINFDDIIKVLNLGADMVMLGSILAKSLEACGDVYLDNVLVNTNKLELFNTGHKMYRNYRGMSTKEVQKSLGKEVLTTSEGISTKVEVGYTLKTWIENFDAYLRSAMAYSDCLTLKDFVGNQNYIHITDQAIKRYKK